jgi:tripartite-type tricarboxylate transporter receptor subunit TctC
MTPARPRTLCRAATIAAALLLPLIGAAQTYPNRPVRLIVSFPAGGASDTVARILGNKLAEQLGQPVIVDSRPGGSGVIGVEIARSAPPDGYTLLMATVNTFALLPALKPRLPYDPEKDFVALTRVASGGDVIAVHPSLGVGTVAGLVKVAKARPGQLNYGTSGTGTNQHLGGEMFNVLAGVQTTHVPYKGVVLALNDLITGQLQFILASPIFVMPHAKTGRLRVVATTGAKRDPLLPELPAVAESLPGYEMTAWQGVAVPMKTPLAIVDKLHTEIVKALRTTEVRELLVKQGVTAHAESQADFTAFIKAERERLGRVGRRAGITLD